MFNFKRFLSNMQKKGYRQVAASNGYPRIAKYGELRVQPKSMPGWTFFFIKDRTVNSGPVAVRS